MEELLRVHRQLTTHQEMKEEQVDRIAHANKMEDDMEELKTEYHFRKHQAMMRNLVPELIFSARFAVNVDLDLRQAITQRHDE